MIYPEIVASLCYLRTLLVKAGEDNRAEEVQAQIDMLVRIEPKAVPTFQGRKHTEETKERMRAAKRGNKNRVGKHHSEEAKNRIRDGRRRFEEGKNNNDKTKR